MKQLTFLLSFLLLPYSFVFAQETPESLYQLDFRPTYLLPGNAGLYPGPRNPSASSRFERFQQEQQVFRFQGETPTEVQHNLLEGPFPKAAFSLEILLYHHVNQPLSAAIYALAPGESQPKILLTFANERDDNTPAAFTFGMGTKGIQQPLVVADAPRFQQYWFHVIATVDGESTTLYVNGKQMGNAAFVAPENAAELNLTVAAYLAAEPYMQLGNVVRNLNVYSQALSAPAVQKRFEAAQDQVNHGILYPGIFHFNAGPYLNYATPSTVNLVWEANIPSQAEVWYGTELPLTQQVPAPQLSEKSEPGYEAYIHELSLTDLKAHTKYFYEVRLTSFEGEAISSGIFSFQTAVSKEESFAFAAFGDTEARPHINDQIAKQVWGERPDFAINLGDLTDGGKKDHKWQWNYEYFEGMNQLHSRLPLFPVAGNGESDLYWYKKYHVLPGNEAYYSFDYGNARFFMLNSNRRADQFQPGGEQYKWLETQLKSSDAQWNFVALHHAPYSTDENDYGNSWEGVSDMGDLKVKPLVPLFERYGVDIVFFGHLHSYSRMGPISQEQLNEEQGVWYVQAGGAGGNLEDFAPTRSWFSEKVFAGHHYCMIYVSGGRLSFRMYDLEGRLRDYMELEK